MPGIHKKTLIVAQDVEGARFMQKYRRKKVIGFLCFKVLTVGGSSSDLISTVT
jgi:hypothetical protein